MFTFTFTPVCCHKGRKWRGDLAYYLGKEMSGSFGTISSQLYDPVVKRYVYANCEFTEPLAEPDSNKTAQHQQEYLDWILSNNMNYCRGCKPNATEPEIKSFCRNIIRKYHPELQEWIDTMLPDTRDTAQEVENSIKWAMSLKTRPCVMYGHICKGGKPYPIQKVANIAYASLKRKGIAAKPEFQTAWQFFANQYGLPDVKIDS